MPVVFNTGEREPRPLFPDQVAYTTAQKVADILQIPFPDPVELTENSGTGGAGFVKISPADHRLVGFEAGDKVEIASDASMGETMTIADNGVTRDGAHVKITFTGNMTDDHLTADVATIQSLQSFTNGKRRGVTRKAVETMILRMQDKIDNLTNNSWRPMLQTAEYLNFDTYKPYRRRYYTDYVGTVPLMFRNVQQILRLEIWQGQEYREVGAAEARLEILDHSALTTNDYLFLCPGGGGVASLQVGTGSSKWSADFDGVNAAQQLADLINKDLRRKKDAVAFSPSFTLETSSTSSGSTTANVHHEFMASANADYGNSKLKISSMNRGEAGETATLGLTNLTAMSATNLTDTVVTVPVTHTVSAGGSGYSVGDNLTQASTTGSGSNFTCTVASVSEGAIVTVTVTAAGSGYVEDEVITLSGSGGKVTVKHVISGGVQSVTGSSGSGVINLPSTAALSPYGIICTGSGTAVKCAYYTGKTAEVKDDDGNITTYGTLTGVTDLASSGFVAALKTAMNTTQTTGTSLTQYRLKIDYFGQGTGDEARLRDWWCDYDLGIIYFNNTYPYFQWNSVKASYVYGERYVEKAIEDICTKMVAMDLLLSDDRSILLPEGTQNIDLGAKYQLMKAQVAETLPRYMEVMTIE
mgnify:CR=1 FL=1